jgi:hypothetical protein
MKNPDYHNNFFYFTKLGSGVGVETPFKPTRAVTI